MKSKGLRIGVDARPLRQPTTGIGRCTYELLSRLLEGPHQWFLYSDGPLAIDLASFTNVTLREGKHSGRITGLVYSQCAFPCWARRDSLDIYWSPRHQLPLLLPNSLYTLVSIYDLVWKRFPETMTRLGRLQEKVLMPRAIHRADKILAVSHFTRDEVVSEFPEAQEKTVIIEAAASFPPSVEGRRYESIAEPQFFLFVGTLEPRKNLGALLCAYRCYVNAAIAKRGRSTVIGLKIVGATGWGRIEVGALITEYKLQRFVEVIGSVDDTQLAKLYGRAQALLMPSLYEGFGLPVVEAMHYGLPVLISKGTSLVEVAGSAGLAVDPNNLGAMAAAISSLAEDSTLRRQLSRQAPLEAERYSWDASAEKLRELITKAQLKVTAPPSDTASAI